MIPGAAISAGVQGLVGIAGGIIGSGARKREQRAAQAEFNAAKKLSFIGTTVPRYL